MLYYVQCDGPKIELIIIDLMCRQYVIFGILKLNTKNKLLIKLFRFHAELSIRLLKLYY